MNPNQPQQENGIENFKETLDEVKIVWNCHFRHGYHTIGCPHKEWTKEQLQNALESKMKFEQSGLQGKVLGSSIPEKIKGDWEEEFERLVFSQQNVWGHSDKIRVVNAEHLGDVEGKLIPQIKSFISSERQKAKAEERQRLLEEVIGEIRGRIEHYPTQYRGEPFLQPAGWSKELEDFIISLIKKKI